MSYRQPFRGEYPITQAFGEFIPGVTVGKLHTGIDYGCPVGTPILASAKGTVMATGWDTTGYGFRVIIRHTSDRATLYAHLDSISVSIGQHVEQGQEIGESGATGNVTGPHLHFEAREQWNRITTAFDPCELPLMTVDDTIATTSQNLVRTSQNPAQVLKDADAFQTGDQLIVTAPAGCRAFFDTGFDQSRMVTYTQGTHFYATGDIAINPNNGLTYMRCIPVGFSVWIALHDGETQILDTIE